MIVDDQELMRIGLRAIIARIAGTTLVGEADNGQDAISLANQLHPAIIFMDVNMPHLDGIQATRAIKEAQPDIRIIMFTASENQKEFLEALDAGADGYCLKNATEQQLSGAINAVMQGAKWLDSGVAHQALQTKAKSDSNGKASELSTEQRQIFELVVAGFDLNQIATVLKKPLTNLKMELKISLEKLRGAQDAANDIGITYRRLQDMLDAGSETKRSRSEPETLIGQVFAEKFVVEAVIGEGGMSKVYRVRHLLMDKILALKVLHVHLRSDSLLVKRLQNEARAAGSVTHRNIVAVHDFGVTAANEPYLVMDYVNGETLLDMFCRMNPPLKLCMELFLQLCDALITLHSHGIIHRDLKMSNIMLVDENGKLTLKVLDFGIAKAISSIESDLTLAGEIFGSPAYMSPEQCQGKAVDVRSDLYSAGCILYHLLTGGLPFSNDDAINIMWRQVYELPSRLPFLSDDNFVPLRLYNALFRLLNKDPDKRFQTASALRLELEACSVC